MENAQSTAICRFRHCRHAVPRSRNSGCEQYCALLDQQSGEETSIYGVYDLDEHESDTTAA